MKAVGLAPSPRRSPGIPNPVIHNISVPRFPGLPCASLRPTMPYSVETKSGVVNGGSNGLKAYCWKSFLFEANPPKNSELTKCDSPKPVILDLEILLSFELNAIQTFSLENT